MPRKIGGSPLPSLLQLLLPSWLPSTTAFFVSLFLPLFRWHSRILHSRGVDQAGNSPRLLPIARVRSRNAREPCRRAERIAVPRAEEEEWCFRPRVLSIILTIPRIGHRIEADHARARARAVTRTPCTLSPRLHSLLVLQTLAPDSTTSRRRAWHRLSASDAISSALLSG